MLHVEHAGGFSSISTDLSQFGMPNAAPFVGDLVPVTFKVNFPSSLQELD